MAIDTPSASLTTSRSTALVMNNEKASQMIAYSNRQSWPCFQVVSDLLDVRCSNSVDTQKVVRTLHRPLDELQTKVNQLSVLMKGCSAELEANRQAQVQQQVEITSELTACTNNMNRNNSNLSELNSKVGNLERKQQDLVNQENHLQGKLRDAETKRQDALTDLIPGVGLIGGLVTGRYERIIPGHSAISGLVSVCTQDLERAQRELSQTRFEYSRAQEDKNRVEAESVILRRQAAKLENEKLTLKREESALTTKMNYVSQLNNKLLNCVTGLKTKSDMFRRRFLSVEDEVELLEPTEWNNDLSLEFRKRLREFDSLIWTGSDSLANCHILE